MQEKIGGRGSFKNHYFCHIYAEIVKFDLISTHHFLGGGGKLEGKKIFGGGGIPPMPYHYEIITLKITLKI